MTRLRRLTPTICAFHLGFSLVLLVLATGLRLAEVANLRPADLKERCIALRGKVGQRQVPISPEVKGELTTLVNRDHIWWGQRGPLGRDGVARIYRRLFRKS